MIRNMTTVLLLLAMPALGQESGYWVPGRQTEVAKPYWYAIHSLEQGAAGLSYVCDRSGRSELVLWGRGGRQAVLRADIDGQIYRLVFRPTGTGALMADLSADASVLRTMQAGRRVRLTDGAGKELLQIGLAGAAHSIGNTVTACRSPGQ